jgi:hypothetical protein
MKLLNLLAVIFSLFCMSEAHALTSPIGISLFPPVQLPPTDFTITGVRLDLIWGDHYNVYGIDVGTLVNSTRQNFGGLEFAGGLNINHGSANVFGVQLAGIANINEQKLYVLGIQAALINSNSGEATLVGFQLGAANLNAHTKVYGFELGLYNRALSVTGFQIGLINSTADLHGLQIGLLNFNDHGLFAVAPILNIGF